MIVSSSYPIRRVLEAGLLTGCTDGAFAIAHALVTKHRFMPVRIFQGIASGVLGPSAFTEGGASAMLGVLLHFVIALIWSALYATLVRQSPTLRAVAHSRHGTFRIAVVYGPFIWLFMYFVVIPLVGIPTGSFLTWSFAFMLVGHVFSVGVPIVAVVADGAPR